MNQRERAGQENQSMTPLRYFSNLRQPVRVLVLLTACIFVIETFSQSVTHLLSPMPRVAESIFHAMLLIALLGPALYFSVVRSLNRSLRECEWAEQTRSKLAAIVESSDDAIYSTDPDDMIVSWNGGAERIYGYSSGEVNGRSISLLVPQDRWHELLEIREKVKRGERVDHFETIRVRKDGKQIHVSLSISPIRDGEKIVGVSAVSRDVTARKQAEEHLRSFFTISPDLLCIAGFDGYFKQISQSWEETLGYGLDDLLSRPWLDFVHPDDREATIQAGSQLFGGKRVIRFENRYRTKDGSFRWIEWHATPLVEENLIYAVARDVTDRKRAIEEIERRTMELESANKELEAFSYSAAHDLRSPLIGVGSLARMLVERYSTGLEARGQEILHVIQKETEQMRQLVDDLLAFSRFGRQVLQLSDIDMNQLVQGVIEQLRLCQGTETLELNVRPIPPARGDPVMIRQVFMNLLSNAAKFTRSQPRGVIEIGGKAQDNANIYYVKDNGVGFDMRDADKLFEVFKRLHPSEKFEGTGIGLAIVKRIVERHCGHVWAEGKIDEGATFYFSLPFSPC